MCSTLRSGFLRRADNYTLHTANGRLSRTHWEFHGNGEYRYSNLGISEAIVETTFDIMLGSLLDIAVPAKVLPTGRTLRVQL